jgi:hypothetical protein
MKKSLYLLLLILISSCTHQTKNSSNLSIKKNSVLADNKDSVVIDSTDGYRITKGDLREIAEHHPELITDFEFQPDIAYHQQHDINFSSEIGQDSYYLLYAYLLKNKNGDIKSREERIKLMDVYDAINAIYDKLNYGGTNYSHQYSRIPAYVEYSIYEGKNNDYYIKTYNIARQKRLYLNSIKQLITDELNNSFDIAEIEKPQLKKKLFETVNHMNGLITNTFYLKMAQEFQYSNY